MRSRILFIVDSGLGNQIQTLPALLYCKKKYNKPIDVYILNKHWIEAAKILFGNFVENVFYKKKQLNVNDYYGKIFTYPTRNISILKNIKDISVRHGKKCSEVEYSMELVGCDYCEEDFDISDICSTKFKESDNKIDILFQDGYSKISQDARITWKPKSYPYYEKLAKIFTKNSYSVGSMGSPEEYIKGTKDLTNLNLDKTIKLIKSCKLLICNDTAVYHLANILNKKNMPIFTFTSLKKNYDCRFHKSSLIVRREDLECSPCQAKKRFWLKNKKKCKWACRDIDPNDIFKKALKLLGE